MKKVLSLVFTLAISLSLLTVPGFAAAADVSPVEPHGLMPASQAELAQWLVTTEETVELAVARAQEEAAMSATTATWETISSFSYYGQETSTSCAAAAVKMALKALTGTTFNESTVRTGCKWDADTGITMANCVSYINKVQSIHSYSAKHSIIHSWFTNNLYDAISASAAPAIVGIVSTTEDGWFYNTSGHALAIYGVKSDKSAYQIADPWGGYVNVSTWKQYTKTDDALFKAYSWTHGYMV